jgi:hypothetical protein
LFNCGGRTGNQLFQISHAFSYRTEKEWLVSVGFGATRSLLDGSLKKHWLSIDNTLLQKIIGTFLYPLFYHGLVRTGISSSHYESNNRCVIRPGRMAFLTIMRGEFESFTHLAAELALHFRLNKAVLAKVRPIIDSIPRGKTPVFLHVRRSDFQSLSLALPDKYYLKAIRLFRDRHPDSFFFIVGDDPDHAETIFRQIEAKIVSRMSPFEDMALMASCAGGILSNSTFAWWGAFFGKGKLGYVVPRFWSGWACKEWRPPEIFSDFMTDILNVEDDSD